MSLKNAFKIDYCRRGCESIVSTLSRSHFGLPAEIKEKYHLICERCMTKKERAEMLAQMGKFISEKMEKM